MVKEGAEALNCASIQPQGVGVAVKVADGGYRAYGAGADRGPRQVDARERAAGSVELATVSPGRRRAPVGRLEPILTLRGEVAPAALRCGDA